MSLLHLLTSGASGGLAPLPVATEAPHPYMFPSVAPWSVKHAAITPTYDGSGSAVHPSVVDTVAEGFTRGFRGWRYWMAMTPYDSSKVHLENPSILVSNNGYQWHVPVGVTNPLDDPATSADKGGSYNSDTELVWDKDRQRFVVYWRRAFEWLHAAESADGVTWTPSFRVAGKAETGTSTDLVSPAIVRDGPDRWRMWTGEEGQDARWSFGVNTWTASDALGPWTAGPKATFTGPLAGNVWHYAVHWDAETSHYFMLASTWVGHTIHAAVSGDGVTWVSGPTLISDGFTYRPTFTRSLSAPGWYNVWYSATTTNESGVNNWWIKHTQLPRTAWTSLLSA